MIEKLDIFDEDLRIKPNKDWSVVVFHNKINEIIDWINVHSNPDYNPTLCKSPESKSSTGSLLEGNASKDTNTQNLKGCGKPLKKNKAVNCGEWCTGCQEYHLCEKCQGKVKE